MQISFYSNINYNFDFETIFPKLVIQFVFCSEMYTKTISFPNATHWRWKFFDSRSFIRPVPYAAFHKLIRKIYSKNYKFNDKIQWFMFAVKNYVTNNRTLNTILSAKVKYFSKIQNFWMNNNLSLKNFLERSKKKIICFYGAPLFSTKCHYSH